MCVSCLTSDPRESWVNTDFTHQKKEEKEVMKSVWEESIKKKSDIVNR